MRICKFQRKNGQANVGLLEETQIRVLSGSLTDILHADSPSQRVQALLKGSTETVALSEVTLLPPLDQQEVWAAGVTYIRSREARERESVGAAKFYDLVYSADRPELFFKATAARVVGPNSAVRIRSDSKWSVPEPELTLVVSDKLKLVGFTIGNDMSSRDIEGENPLYLPQAKLYAQSCALGPAVTLLEAMPARDKIQIQITIERAGQAVFTGSTSSAQLARTFEDLISWLGRENHFPQGVYLLTGTGIVPPDHFTLAADDVVTIDITGIGQLRNQVVQG